MFRDEGGGGLAREPVGSFVDKATTTVLSTNRVDSGSLSSQCCAFRHTHASADPIRLLCIRRAVPLTIFLPSRFAPNARLWLVFYPVSYDLRRLFRVIVCWDERGGGLTGQPVGLLVDTAAMTTVMSANRVSSGSFSSRGCAFRRTHTSADPIRLLSIRLLIALPSTLSLGHHDSPPAKDLRLVFYPGPYGSRGFFWVERKNMRV